MTAQIIDGKAFAKRLRDHISGYVAQLQNEHSITPGLAVVLVGDNPASEVYVRSKARQTVEVGMKSVEHKLSATTSQDELLSVINQLNSDDTIHGILVQLPLPDHLDEALVINAISPEKDVDGFHISNAGLLATGQKAMVPCTPLGCLMMLRDHFGSLSGKHAVVVGRSNIVGKPMAQLLLQDSCTVSIVHSRTQNIQDITSQADIVIAAVGRAEIVTEDWIKHGAVVIDVGINRMTDENNKSYLTGDVNFEQCSKKAEAITPVPGGVGPMTIGCLLANTLTACCRIHGVAEPEGLTA